MLKRAKVHAHFSDLFLYKTASRAQRGLQVCLAVACLALAACPESALAQAAGSKRGLLLNTADHSDKSIRELNKRLNEAVVAAAPVQLISSPHPKLSNLQAQANCRDQSATCLRALAQIAAVEVVIVPSIDRGDGDLVLTLRAFDSTGDGTVSEVAHWQDGKKPSPETLEALPDLVRGLFRPKPVPTAVEHASSAPSGEAGAAREAPQDDLPLRLAPWLLLGGGAIVLGAGVISGAVMRGTEHDYKSTTIRTRMDAEKAHSLLQTANTEAVVAEVCIGIGAAALLAGGAWLTTKWLMEQRTEAQPTSAARSGGRGLSVSPVVSPKAFGLVLQHQGGWF